jgi:hypothetical protein
MTWYAAHIVMAVKFKRGEQNRFPVWENIVLISAESEEEAFAKAEERGRCEEGDDGGTFTWGDRPATRPPTLRATEPRYRSTSSN